MRNILLIIVLGLLLGNCKGNSSTSKDYTPCSVNENIVDTCATTVTIIQSDSLVECRDSFVYNDGHYSYTELGLACKEGDLDKVKTLINKGACTERCMDDEFYEYDMIYIAVLFEHVELVRYFVNVLKEDVNLIYNEDGVTLLYIATRSNDLYSASEISKILIEAGAKVNGSGDHGTDYVLYPLFNAVKSNNIELVKYLISHGADPNIIDKQDRTIYNLAVQDKSINEEMKAYIKTLATESSEKSE